MKLDTIINQPVIEAERFILRPVRRSDAGLIAMHAGDQRVASGTRTIPHPLPPGSVEAFIARCEAEDRIEDAWIIDGSALGHAEVMGLVSLTRMDRAQSEIAYWVAPAFWNTGIAQEALRVLVAANPQDTRTLFAVVFQDNPASARVLTNVGFQFIGDAEAFSVARGAVVPTWTYIRQMG
jgi:RimJ/RimL family protein N-acetyltransferase